MVGESSTGATAGARRLAAIMCADIAGFSRLMGRDEEGTHARLKRYRRDIIEPTVAEHYGHIVKHTGDGFLAIFDSPLEATRCAIVIQQSIAGRNAALSKDMWLLYRIGINLGDIIVEEDDIYGDGVNIAARLQTAATPGEVNISGGVYEQVKNKLVCGYQSLGDEKLKNITDPVHIYRVLPDPAAVSHARPLHRFLPTAVSAAAVLVLGFGAGLWVTGRVNPRLSPPMTTALSPEPVPTAPAVAEAVEPDALPGLPPAPLPLGPLPPILPTAPEPRTAPKARVAALPVPTKPDTGSTNAFRDCQGCPEMVRVRGGGFKMGSKEDPTEEPVRHVTVAAFAIGTNPVTIGEWRACVAAKACDYQPIGDDDDLPVFNISWDDARQYAAWLAKVTRKPYRLPSEAEWEYAARGDTTTAYWWGETVTPGMAECKTCGGSYDPATPMKVGLTAPNPFGLHGVAGGVNQWVADCWHKNYAGAPRNGSAWDTPNCRERVLRGGSWRNEPGDLRVASRAHYESDVRYPAHGLRVAVTETQGEP